MQYLELQSQQKIIKKIVTELKRCAKEGSKVNHTLVIGDRGTGRTTVIRKIFDEIERTPALKKVFNPILIPFSLNGNKIESLVSQKIIGLEISAAKKHHLLFVDDLHLILEDSKDEAHQIRKMLLRNEPKISMIATATRSFQSNLSHDKALYGFLRVLELEKLTDQDMTLLMQDIIENKTWIRLNEDLVLANVFWLQALTGGNLRLLTVLRNLVFSTKNSSFKTEDFVRTYFELTGPSFQNEIMKLPKNNRYFLEAASLLGQFFQPKEVELEMTNVPQEAIRLLNRGYLKRKDKGKYTFSFPPLKAWFRYVKNLPLRVVVSDAGVQGSTLS